MIACCKIKSLTDPNTFCFQYWASFLTLFLLTKLSCTIGCTVTAVGTAVLLLFVSWKFTKWLRRTFFHERLGSAKKAVLVTGCDSGFGNRLANRLNNHGYTVYAACLDPNGSGPQQLLKTAAFPKATKLIQMNVTSDEDVDRALEEVKTSLKKDGVKLWAIVNNAGICKVAHVEWGKLEDYQTVFDVNVIGIARVTRAFLPLIRESKGRVVNVASVAGRVAGPGLGIYCMSKYAVVAFSASLRREMLPWGVKVSTIEPAMYKTPLADPKNLKDGLKKMWDESSDSVKNDYGEEYYESLLPLLDGKEGRDNPEEVVDAMYDAISDVEPAISYRVYGLTFAFLWWGVDYLPCSIQDILLKLKVSNTLPKAAKLAK